MRKLLVLLILLPFVASCGRSADNAKPADRPATDAKVLSPGKKIVATGTIEPEEMVNVCGKLPAGIRRSALIRMPRASRWTTVRPWRRARSRADRQRNLYGPRRTGAGRLPACRSRTGQGKARSGTRRGPVATRPGSAEGRGQIGLRFRLGRVQLQVSQGIAGGGRGRARPKQGRADTSGNRTRLHHDQVAEQRHHPRPPRKRGGHGWSHCPRWCFGLFGRGGG